MFLFGVLLLTLALGPCETVWNVTCDFDLDNIDAIVKYLPVECQNIYKAGSKSDLYKSSLIESKKFQEFYHRLDAYERKQDSTPKDGVPKQNKELRYKIYNTSMINECSQKVANSSESLSEKGKAIEFYGCLTAKREEMIKLVPT